MHARLAYLTGFTGYAFDKTVEKAESLKDKYNVTLMQ